jgi:hypothetical protein
LIASWSKQLCSTICKSNFVLNLVFAGCSIIIISDESWHVFLKRFATSVQHITGQEVEVKEARENASINIIMEQELELLRAKVDELTDEVTCLCLHLNIVLIVL